MKTKRKKKITKLLLVAKNKECMSHSNQVLKDWYYFSEYVYRMTDGRRRKIKNNVACV